MAVGEDSSGVGVSWGDWRRRGDPAEDVAAEEFEEFGAAGLRRPGGGVVMGVAEWVRAGSGSQVGMLGPAMGRGSAGRWKA